MPVTNDEAIRTILRDAKVIAVVGCSGTPGKAAHDVPAYMLDHGYDVVPVNPVRETVLGRTAVDAIGDVTESVDIVDVFRPSEEVAGIVDATLARDDDPVVWTQLGIRDRDATDRAEAEGLTVVEDKCIKVEHDRLLG